MNHRSTPRFVCENWEPEVKVKMQAERTPARKVVTRGTVTLSDCGIINRATQALRRGYEVHIGQGIRLYPCMSNDFRHITVIAQTLDEFRNGALTGLHAHLVHRGVEVDADEFAEESASHREECAKRMAACSVTPDTMVTCPNCGTQFRVGQRLSA